MDCTQVLESDVLDDSLAYKYKVKVAELKVNSNVYPIFSGSNRIGRDPEFCSVVFNNMTLSKEHAVIEVDDRFSHLIYDLGSKNKTKLGKMILKPHVRYQLVDKSQILFGDLLAEYFVLPDAEENRPFTGIIQESDDEVIPDTPVQSRSREVKESSSSREESPTIFQMETQCEIGYDEPCVVRDPGESEGKLEESTFPQDRSKESSASGASKVTESLTASATGTSEELVSGTCENAITTEGNNASDGDETDPEDMFFAMTQKRDECISESGSKGRSKDDEKDIVENGEVETSDQVMIEHSKVSEAIEKPLDHNNGLNSDKEKDLCSSKMEDLEEDIFSAATQVIVPASKVQELSEKCLDKSCDENRTDKSEMKRTTSLDSEETNEERESASDSMIRNPQTKSEETNLFKVPLAADKRIEKIVQVIESDTKETIRGKQETAGPGSETNKEDDDDSIFNAATQIFQSENKDTETFKVPLAVKKKVEQSKEGTKNNDNKEVGMKQGTADSDSSKNNSCDSIYDAPTQALHAESVEVNLYKAVSGIEKKQEVQFCSELDEKKIATEKECSVDSVSETDDDDDSIFNAPTQVVHFRNEPAKPDHVSQVVAVKNKLNTPAAISSFDETNSNVKETREKQKTVESDSSLNDENNSIFDAPTQVTDSGKRDVNSGSMTTEVLKKSEHSGEASRRVDVKDEVREMQHSADSSIEILCEDVSVFEAATQIIHSENKDINSSKALFEAGNKTVQKEQDKKEVKGKQETVGSNYKTKDDSICDVETQIIQLESNEANTFKVPTPAKKKSVAFMGISDEKRSNSIKHAPEKEPKGHASEADKDDSIFDAPTQIIEHNPTSSSFKGSDGSDSKSSKVAVFSEKNKKQETEHETSSAEPCGTSEVRLSNSPVAYSLDDSDDSIFTAPTQIISKTKSVDDSEPPQVDKIEKLASSSRDGSKDNLAPESALKVVPSTKGNTDSIQDITDVLEDSSKNEDSLNDSFFEAPTQLYASTVEAMETEDDDGDDDKAKTPSLSRSSSYGSIHEAPTQCMDDLEASVNDANVKTIVSENSAQAGSSVEVEEGERDVAKNAVEVTLPERNTAAVKENVDLILPSSQELRQVGQEYYGYASDDDRPSTSFDTSSPILQKRTRTIPARRGGFMSGSSDTVKPTLSSGSKSTDSQSATPSTSAGDKKLSEPVVDSPKRRLKLSLKRSDRKKIAGAGDVAVDTEQEVGKSKKITDFWGKAKNTRDKSANEMSEENNTSNESETGRPSRVRKPTWKARENSQDMLQTTVHKGKKDETKEHSNVSPLLSKQAKSHISSPSGGDTSNKQRKSGIVVSPGDQAEVKDVNKTSTMKNKTNTKASTNTRAHSTSSESNTESKSTTSSPSNKRKHVLDISSSSKRQRSTRLPLSTNSDQNNRKAEDGTKGGKDVSVSNAESTAERITVRSRRKHDGDVSLSSGNQKKDTGSVHESHENEKAGPNKRSRSKLSVASSDSSGSKVESKPVDDKKKQNSDISVVSDNPRKTRVTSSSGVQEKKAGGGKGGRPKRSIVVGSASSSDIETEPVEKREEPKSSRTRRKISAPYNDKDEIVEVNARGRPKRSATASSASNSDAELKPGAHAKRSNDSDICDTPSKQQKTGNVPSHGVRDKSAGTVKRDRSKRSAKNAFGLDVELNPAVDVVPKEQIEESNICDTPKKQRKISAPLSDGNQEESVNTRRGRSKRSVAASTSPASKKDSTSRSKVTPDEVIKVITKPRSAEQRNTVLHSVSSDELDSKKEDFKDQKRSRGRKNNSKLVVSEDDQSVCNSPSYGASGKRRKALLQVSSTESDGQSSQGETTPKRSSRLKHQVIYHIMFTGVTCSDTDETTIKKLGGKIVQELETCSILITDKIRRTLKFLCMLGQGKPIVSPDWIKQSQQSGQFLDPWNFIVKDKEAEKRYSFQLKRSLKEASSKKILDGFTVFATPSVKPPPAEMKSIVENSGGQFLTKEPPGGKWPEKSFIISAIDDKKLCGKFKKTSVPIVSAEILLTGILQQKLNMSDYILKL